MKLARLIAVALALLVAGSAVAEAQGGRRGGNRMNPAQMLLRDITLTADQQVKVDTLVAKYDADMAAFRRRTGGNGPTEESRAEMMKMRTGLQTDLRAVLTVEQQAVFDRNVQAMAERMQRRPPPGNRS